MRKLRLQGSTAPWVFFELKAIFHLLESVGSARIEGNRTTVAEYIDQKSAGEERSTERYAEIANVEDAMKLIEDSIDAGTEITHTFIRELHQLAVSGLTEEGDRTPGAYRTWNVGIKKASHVPPEAHRVEHLMDELLVFINQPHSDQYDLLKTAIAHHRFAWVHPFGNGNGRVVRLLTYAMLIKYGFNVKEGQILNPTAVFCNDRDQYYAELANADLGDDAALLSWCEYVLSGILDEITKVNKLLDFEYMLNDMLLPAVQHAADRKLINHEELIVLKAGVRSQSFRLADIEKLLGGKTKRQVSYLLKKMKEGGMVQIFPEGSRTYRVSFHNQLLMGGLIKRLAEEGFIPNLNG